MLQFPSPLPRNYDKIVHIFTHSEETKCGETSTSTINQIQAQTTMGYIDPWLDPSMSIRTPEPTLVESKTEPGTLCVKSVVSEKAPEKAEQVETETKSEPQPELKPEIKAETPFVIKPVIATPVPETKLTELGNTYMEQREQMLKTREAINKADMKDTEQELKEEISQDVKDKQKQLFEEQQAALRALRLKAAVPETKAKADVEQAMPLPAPEMPNPPTRNPIPQDYVPSIPVSAMRVDQLKLLCSKRGLSAKGNKAELVARLQSSNVENFLNSGILN